MDSTASAEMLRGRSILVAEDNAFLADYLCVLLAEIGCLPRGPAKRLSEALRLSDGCDVDGSDLDGAILDVQLGIATSFEVARKLLRRGIPCLFVTGCCDEDAFPEDLRHVPRVAKPYGEDDILSAAAHAFAPPARPAFQLEMAGHPEHIASPAVASRLLDRFKARTVWLPGSR